MILWRLSEKWSKNAKKCSGKYIDGLTYHFDAFVLQEPERESNEGSYCFQVLKFLRLSGRTTTFDNT